MSFEKRDGKIVIYNIETGEEWIGAGIDAREIYDQGGWSKKPVVVSRETDAATEYAAPKPVVAPESVVVVEEIVALEPAPEPVPPRRGRPAKQ